MKKLLLILVVGPLVGLLYFALPVWQGSQEAQKLSLEVDRAVQLTDHIATVIGAVELERGHFALDRNQTAKSRERTDQTVANLQRAQSAGDAVEIPGLLRALAEIRSYCDLPGSVANDCFDRYTGQIEEVIASVTDLRRLPNREFGSSTLQAHALTLRLREAVARERGLGVLLIAESGESERTQVALSKARMQQQVVVDLLSRLGAQVEEAERLFGDLADAGSAPAAGQNADAWFERQSARIEAAAALERLLLSDARERASQAAEEAAGNLLEIEIAVLLLVLLGSVSGGLIARHLSVLLTRERSLRAKSQELSERVERSRQELSAIISIANDSIISMNEDQEIIRFNQGAELTFGYQEKDIVGQNIEVLMPEEARADHPAHVAAFAKDHQSSRLMRSRNVVRGLKRDGSLFPARASISKVDTPDGMIFTAIIRDETEIEAAMTEVQLYSVRLEEINTSLKAAIQTKNELLGMAAHDLRNPLTLIKATAGLLESPLYGRRDAEEVALLQRISASSQFMLRLIDDVLDISVIESGELKLDREETDVVRLVENTVEIMRPMAELKGIQISEKHAENLPLVLLDPDKTAQVLQNLISNAVKYSESGTDVEVSTESDAERVTIHISDRGQGIPGDEVGRLFQPFERLTPQPTAGEKSTGLGLTIAHRIVLEHGGRIAVESEVGEGSTFSVLLPHGQEGPRSDTVT